jgi:tetratricopeptide (TPR) repeat protein
MQAAAAAYRRGRWDAAALAFSRARQAYLERGQALKAAEAANNLSVTLLQAGKPEQALEAVRGTPEAFLSASETRLAAQAYGNLGAALEACGRLNEAEAAYRRSIDLLDESGDVQGRAMCLQSLSRVLLRQGKPIEALGSMQSGLEAEARPSLTKRLLRRLLRLPGRVLGNH